MGIAGIGIGGMGAANLKALEEESIVALCDVDPGLRRGHGQAVSEGLGSTPTTALSSTKKKGVDAVVIATPDHTHAVITMVALRAGKHVYTTEAPDPRRLGSAPGSRSRPEASKLTTQMGIQGHSGEGIRLVVEWVRAGLIGEVREVDAWCDLSYYPWGHAYWSSKWGERPADAARPPRPAWPGTFGSDRPRSARTIRPTIPWSGAAGGTSASGMMGDRGAHTLDAAVGALGLDAQKRSRPRAWASIRRRSRFRPSSPIAFPPAAAGRRSS